MFRQVVFHLQASGISTMHDQLGRFGQWLFRIAYFHADGVIQLSPDTIDKARGLCAKRAFFVANCAEDEFERFRPLIEAKAASNSTPIRLLYLSTVCQSKGILDLIQACHRLMKNGVNIGLRVVGPFQPDAFRIHVEKLMAELDLADHVELCGQMVGDAKNDDGKRLPSGLCWDYRRVDTIDHGQSPAYADLSVR